MSSRKIGNRAAFCLMSHLDFTTPKTRNSNGLVSLFYDVFVVPFEFGRVSVGIMSGKELCEL